MLSFFRLMHLPHQTSSKRKGLFDCFSSVNKKRPFAPFLRNSSQNRKNVHQFLHFYQFCLIFIGKDEVFHGLLYKITRRPDPDIYRDFFRDSYSKGKGHIKESST